MTLFERIGGYPAVQAAVEGFYKRIVNDPFVNHHFANTDITKQKGKMAGFLSFAFGAPVNYTGKSIRDAHAHMKLTQVDFDIVAQHVVSTLEELNVAPDLIEEVLAILVSVREDVVTA